MKDEKDTGMSRYLIVIEKADNNYSAYSPDLPGFIATGTNPEVTEKNMQEAIALHIHGLLEDGLPIPAPQSVAGYVAVED